MENQKVLAYDKVGGWLILPAIGLIVTIAGRIYSLATEYLPLFTNGIVSNILRARTGLLSPYLIPTLFAEIAVELLVVVFSALLLVQLKNCKPNFPRNMIVFYLSNLFVNTLDLVITPMVSPTNAIPDASYQAVGNALGACVVWIPYLLVSKRVKGTFRHGISSEDLENSHGDKLTSGPPVDN